VNTFFHKRGDRGDKLGPPAPPAVLSAPVPVAVVAVTDTADPVPAKDPRVLAALTQIQAQAAAEHDGPTRRPAYRPRVPIAADYRNLPVFQDTVRAACRSGLTGIGTRGVHPVMPVPDYGLDRYTLAPFTAGAACGAEFDQIAERTLAGFVYARRAFHREDTADFPAVTA
jgi:hypothetical protein